MYTHKNFQRALSLDEDFTHIKALEAVPNKNAKFTLNIRIYNHLKFSEGYKKSLTSGDL